MAVAAELGHPLEVAAVEVAVVVAVVAAVVVERGHPLEAAADNTTLRQCVLTVGAVYDRPQF